MRRMLTGGLALTFLALPFLAGQGSAPAAGSPFAAIPELTAELARLTGLQPLKRVQYDLMTREDLKKFLDQRIKEELRPEDIRIEELALKKLGLVPQDFQLAATMTDVMAEQAEAFYDYRRKKLFLVGGEQAEAIQEAALLHELAHALADQHFHLEKYIRRGKTDDSALARAAVMEGQATWLMYEWMAGKAGQSLRKTPALASMVGSRAGSITSQYPVLNAAPLYIRASLLFPYTQGLQFQQAVIEKLGSAGFSEVFRNPPANSQQILHPEKYFARAAASEPELPRLRKSGGYKELMTASIGEFDHSVLLEQYAGNEAAERVAPEWRGGAIRLLEKKNAGRVVLLYASDWSNPESARAMFDAYRKIQAGKWKSVVYSAESGTVLEGTGDDGVFRVALDGTRLTVMEGLASAAEAQP